MCKNKTIVLTPREVEALNNLTEKHKKTCEVGIKVTAYPEEKEKLIEIVTTLEDVQKKLKN